MNTQREQLIKVAREYVGTPYRHCGRLKGIGVDCAGVIVLAAQEIGMNVRDINIYTRKDDKLLMQEMNKQLDIIDIQDAISGDILLMQLPRQRIPRHMALLTDYGIIHATEGAGKTVVEHILDDRWRKYINAAFRFKEFNK